MVTLNKSRSSIFTHEGAPAKRINAEQQLRRSVMSCLLWEDTFYEEGESIADRITQTVGLVPQATAEAIAVEARNDMNLRHVPLLIAASLAKHGNLKAELLPAIIQRPDELAEFLAIYWKDGKCPLSAQVKKGLSAAFQEFNEYQLAKWDRAKAAIKLRDVMRLVHPKPVSQEQAEMWGRLIDGTLARPDTWESALVGGADKKETFERLIREKKLGAMALVRNLRGMSEAGVDREIIREALKTCRVDQMFPYRWIAAAIHAPDFTRELEDCMFRSAEHLTKIDASVCFCLDCSGSMDRAMSGKSKMMLRDAVAGLAAAASETYTNVHFVPFGTYAALMPSFRGMGLVEAVRSVNHDCHYYGKRGDWKNVGHGTSIRKAAQVAFDTKATRVVIITDEQSHTNLLDPPPGVHGVFINVASYKNGIGYRTWTHLDGFSVKVLDYLEAALNERS